MTRTRIATTLTTILAVVVASSIVSALATGSVAGAVSTTSTLDDNPWSGRATASPAPGFVSAAAGSSDVHAFGAAPALGSLDGANLVHPVETIATTPTGAGYWLSTAAGEIHAFGDAEHFGDASALALRHPIVGMVGTPTGDGYWLVASDGGVFAFGDAPFLGSMGAVTLNEPVVGMAPTPTGAGYWLVASDGGVFSFGDAPFLGSLGDVALNRPIVGTAATRTGRGYWMVASDGGVFTFGDAKFFGSTGSLDLEAPVAAMAATPTGAGYHLVALDGRVYAFGDAPTLGDALASLSGGVATSIAMRPQGDGYWLSASDRGDTVGLWQPGGLQPTVRDDVLVAAFVAGASPTIVHSGTVSMLALRRGSHDVQRATPGWRIPMTSVALDANAAIREIGPHAATALLRGEVVMGERTARLRDARVGDHVDFLGWDGTIRTRRVGAIVPTLRAGSAELFFGAGDAASFGFVRELSITLSGFEDRTAMLAAIAAYVDAPSYFGVSPSWAEAGGDSVLPTVALKERFGEFQYRPHGDGTITIDPAWTGIHIGAVHLPIVGTITCNRTAGAAMAAALADVAAAGLSGLVDVVDTRTVGGCWVPREIRGVSGGSISRHAWGIALDVNPSTNGFGATPTIDPRIVEIFRAHGFAWGGSWARPDGMHFEWVGSG